MVTAHVGSYTITWDRILLDPGAVLGTRETKAATWAPSSFDCVLTTHKEGVDLRSHANGEEAEGCDVVQIPGGNDPALRQARDLLTIPVVAMTESGIHTACMLGQRFGIITMDDASVNIVERNLRDYAMGTRAVTHQTVRSAGFFESGSCG